MKIAWFVPLLCGTVAMAEPAPLTVVSKSGEVGPLQRIHADGSIETTTGERIPLADLVEIRRTGVALPPMPTAPQFVTSIGDRIPGTFGGCDETGVRFRSKLGELRIPLSYADVLWLVRTDSRLATDPAWGESMSPPRKRDLLLLRNRDVLIGTLIRMEAKQGQIEIDGSPQEFESSRVAAVAFNTALTRTRKPTKPYFAITLTDGTRFHLSKCKSEGQSILGPTLFGSDVMISTADVSAIRVMNGRAVYLSDLKPTRYDETPYFSVRWDWSADSAWGHPIQLMVDDHPSTFDKGIALHSSSSIRYSLAKKYVRFDATVGIQQGCIGVVELSIRVDGKDIAIPGGNSIRPGNARSISVPVDGARELEIIVKHGPGGSVQDQFLLGNARLIRK